MGCGVVERHLEMAQPTKKQLRRAPIFNLFYIIGPRLWGNEADGLKRDLSKKNDKKFGSKKL